MDLLQAFRDESEAKKIIKQINELNPKPCNIMEVCGGQTHTILKYGVEAMLHPNINLIHGPGCPVCVTAIEAIDYAIDLSLNKDVIFCTYGDMLRVPGSKSDLFKAKGQGANIKIIYSPLDAIKIAKDNQTKQIVFFAIGFETTAPANAMVLLQAKLLKLKNFSVLSQQVLVPPMIASLLQSQENRINAFLGPGHVCSVMGLKEYEKLVDHFKIPIIITGFEPLDILYGIYYAVQQLQNHTAQLYNQYSRCVSSEGNVIAQSAMQDVFSVCDRKWRGIGTIPKSGLKISYAYKEFDVSNFYNFDVLPVEESSECISGQILKGLKKPPQCPCFGTKCTPATPYGATMVSSEGACAAYYKYARPG